MILYLQLFWGTAFFLLGAICIFIPGYFIYTNKDSCSKSSDSESQWNASDYQSNSEYYGQLPTGHDFTQADNLRLDHLSAPQFHPNDGKSVMYLRQQYHMPDSNGSTTTLHWFDLQTNKTIQLTRPIWGIYDQQVIDQIY